MEKHVGWHGCAMALLIAMGCGDSDKKTPAFDEMTDPDSSVDEQATDPDASVDEEAQDIVETAVAAGSFTVLAKALGDAGLVDALKGKGPFTVFAPTDDAFAALGEGVLESLSAEQLGEILKYHVIAGKVGSADLEAGPVKMLSGLSAFVSLEGGAKVNGVSVTTADVGASNGVVHVIDKVLLPPNIVEAATYAGSFSTLLGAATSAGLAGALSAADANLTVFAPTDAAFAALPAGTVEGLSIEQLTAVLTYHVVGDAILSTELTAGDVETLNGQSVTVSLEGGVRVNTANVVIADLVTTNGVVHVIDAVLLPE